jgi:hypothetical protein
MNAAIPSLRPRGAGKLRAARRGNIRSYDHHGAAFSWQPPTGLDFRRAALDIEAKAQPSAKHMAERFGLSVDEFLRRWTATEALAKVLNIPVLDFLKERGLAQEASEHWSQPATGVWVRAIAHQSHWAAVAVIL